MKNRKWKKRIILTSGGIAAALLLCLLLLPSTIRIRSDSSGVTFVRDGERVTEVDINGPFPYGLAVSSLVEKVVRDDEGKVTEEIQTYTMEAGFSLRRRTSAKIYIEVPEKGDRTYILKFADADVTITNGKVVDPDDDGHR